MGRLDLVDFQSSASGFYERTEDESWHFQILRSGPHGRLEQSESKVHRSETVTLTFS